MVSVNTETITGISLLVLCYKLSQPRYFSPYTHHCITIIDIELIWTTVIRIPTTKLPIAGDFSYFVLLFIKRHSLQLFY